MTEKRTEKALIRVVYAPCKSKNGVVIQFWKSVPFERVGQCKL